MKIQKYALLVLLAGVSSFFGCAAETSDMDSEDDASEEALKSVQIPPVLSKLYRTPEEARVPNAFCDVHTQLDITQSASGATAKLVERVTGNCKLVVAPNERSFRLREVTGACGSRSYRGSRLVGGRIERIAIFDHRTRTCKDLVPAKLIVDETKTTGEKTTVYGNVVPGTSQGGGTASVDGRKSVCAVSCETNMKCRSDRTQLGNDICETCRSACAGSADCVALEACVQQFPMDRRFGPGEQHKNPGPVGDCYRSHQAGWKAAERAISTCVGD